MFSKLDKFEGLIFEGTYIRRGRGGGVGRLIYGMLIALLIWGAYIRGGLYMGSALTGFYGISSETSNSHNIWDTTSLEVFSEF